VNYKRDFIAAEYADAQFGANNFEYVDAQSHKVIRWHPNVFAILIMQYLFNKHFYVLG